MIFLQSHGLGTAKAVSIYKAYGKNAIEKVQTNPYQLAHDVRGIGFKTADTLALDLGIERNSMIRARAGIHFSLKTVCSQGHCAVERSDLIKASQDILDIDPGLIEEAIDLEVEAEKIIQDTLGYKLCLYTKAPYEAETQAAEEIKRLNESSPPWGFHFLQAIPTEAAVIFIGDVDQLPSVGPGSVLADLIQSELIATVHLREIFRQAAGSKIISNAHRINTGKMPESENAQEDDFFVSYMETPVQIQETVIDLVANRIPAKTGCDPMKDIQVLSPIHKGEIGCLALNQELQKKLNPNPRSEITRFGQTYAEGDRVIQTTNNYDKGVFNGDIGFIEKIDLESGDIEIRFDEVIKQYESNELDDLKLAYAITIHKSQGSEFPIVIIPMAMQNYRLLVRKLLYTGVTRGKELVILVGQEKAISTAVKNKQSSQRLTGLKDRLFLSNC